MKKLLVVLSVVLVLALASGAFAASGHVGHYSPTELISKGASAFSSGLSTNAKTALAASAWSDATELSADAYVGSATEFSVSSSNNVIAAYIPKFTVPSNGRFIIRVYLDAYTLINDLTTLSSFVLRDLGSSSQTYTLDAVVALSGTTFNAITDSNRSSLTDATEAYLIFTAAGVASSATVEAASSTANLGLEASGTVNVGSSGGGCVAGTSALALAVLGLFIAKGKK